MLMATVRERSDGVWEVRVYTGRDPITHKPQQISRVVRAGPRTRKGNPPKAVTDSARQLEVEASNRKRAGERRESGTTKTVAFLMDQNLDHVETATPVTANAASLQTDGATVHSARARKHTGASAKRLGHRPSL
jgi:hypothetical protein